MTVPDALPVSEDVGVVTRVDISVAVAEDAVMVEEYVDGCVLVSVPDAVWVTAGVGVVMDVDVTVAVAVSAKDTVVVEEGVWVVVHDTENDVVAVAVGVGIGVIVLDLVHVMVCEQVRIAEELCVIVRV